MISFTVPSSSSRAVSKSCKVTGTSIVCGCGCVMSDASEESAVVSPSSIIWVSSSTNRGTPSVLSTIWVNRFDGSCVSPATCWIIVFTCGGVSVVNGSVFAHAGCSSFSRISLLSAEFVRLFSGAVCRFSSSLDCVLC